MGWDNFLLDKKIGVVWENLDDGEGKFTVGQKYIGIIEDLDCGGGIIEPERKDHYRIVDISRIQDVKSVIECSDKGELFITGHS